MKKTCDSLDKAEEEIKYEVKQEEKDLEVSRGYNTRLRKNDSTISDRPLLEDFSLPDFLLS